MSIVYFFVCLISCVVGAISGIGGGVIIKPVLDALGTLNVSTISFLSGCTVLAMTSMTLFRSRNSDVKIDKRKGTLLAVGGAIGGIVGKYIFDAIKTTYGRLGKAISDGCVRLALENAKWIWDNIPQGSTVKIT